MRHKEVGREKEKRQREKDILAKKRKVEQRDQLLPAPTREETETKETEAPTLLLKHKSTKHRSLRRADNALPSCPRMKKEIVTILSIEGVQCANTFKRTEEIKKKANHFE